MDTNTRPALMNTTTTLVGAKLAPATASYLATLREVVAHKVRARHVLVCSKSDARRAVASLRAEYFRLGRIERRT
jgi:hypothetical protein